MKELQLTCHNIGFEEFHIPETVGHSFHCFEFVVYAFRIPDETQ